MTTTQARRLLARIMTGRHNADTCGASVNIGKTEAICLLEAFIALDEIHRVADLHVGGEYRSQAAVAKEADHECG